MQIFQYTKENFVFDFSLRVVFSMYKVGDFLVYFMTKDVYELQFRDAGCGNLNDYLFFRFIFCTFLNIYL